MEVGEGGGLKLALQSLRVAGRARWPVLTVRLAAGATRSWRRAGSGAVPGVLAPLPARRSHVAAREAAGVRGKEQCCLSVPALISE